MDNSKNISQQEHQKSKLNIEETIYSEVVKALYMALPGSVIATIIIAASMVAILWQEVDRTYLVTWLITIIFFSACRFIAYKLYSKSKKSMQDIYFWDQVFYILLVLIGLTWSCVSIWLLPSNDSIYHYVPALILIGISAGAVTSLGFKMRNIVTYFLFLLVPLFISEVMVGTFISSIVAFLTVVFIILALSNIKRINMAMIENISFRYEAEAHEQELIENKNAAIAANSAKTHFMSMISHELRTPLNAILGYGQLLKMSDLPDLTEEQDDHTQGIIESGKHLLSLIEELLDMSEIEAGNLKISMDGVSLSAVLNESITLLSPVAANSDFEIINKLESDYFIMADHKRLKQVFINLISNALKYKDGQGKVTIFATGKEDGYVRISFSDNGFGISAEQQEDLFNAFTRFNVTKEGIGLGLFITRKLVNMMSGTIGVESEPGNGSTFWVDILLAE